LAEIYLTKFATELYATNVRLFVERRYFKFQNEIQFSSNSVMEQLKHRNSDSFCDCNTSCFYQVLHYITCMT